MEARSLAGRATPMTRRQLLGAALALAVGTAARPAWAAAPARVALGDAEVMVLSDGALSLPMSFFLPDRSAEEIAALLTPHGLPVDLVRPDCNLTLLRSQGRTVLFDAGAGPMFQDTAGKLADSLAAAGIDPAEITDLCFTHAHPDHLWGVVDDLDEPVFPNARFWMNRAEWEFWRAPATLDAMPEERKSFVVGARNRMKLIEERVELFDAGAEVVPGVEAVASVGHTPGHTSFAVHRGSDSLLVVGDAISNAVISFERPDWRSGSDQDQAQGADTRLRLLDRLAGDQARIVGFHLPYPGIGFVERRGSAYRFRPAV